MSDDASRFGPRLYGLFDDLEDEQSADNDQDGNVGEDDGPPSR